MGIVFFEMMILFIYLGNCLIAGGTEMSYVPTRVHWFYLRNNPAPWEAKEEINKLGHQDTSYRGLDREKYI